MSRTRSVIATANTPSLNASIRAVSLVIVRSSLRASPLSTLNYGTQGDAYRFGELSQHATWPQSHAIFGLATLGPLVPELSLRAPITVVLSLWSEPPANASVARLRSAAA